MVARRWLLAALLACAGLGACNSLSVPNGKIACSDDPTRPCPHGYSCIDGLCWLPSADAGASDAGSGTD